MDFKVNSNSDKISIIIPHKDQKKELYKIINDILNWTYLPYEIIIIDSSLKKVILNYKLIGAFLKKGIVIKLLYLKHAYPGLARNIGIQECNSGIICFLDVCTIPDNNWLESSIHLLKKDSGLHGVWGKTYYITENKFSLCAKYATYGEGPLITVPGLLIKYEALKIIGYFISDVRAGEDSDWIMRIKLHKLKLIEPVSFLKYYKLNEMNIFTFIFKWFTNYYSASNLPSVSTHKSIYYHGSVLILIFITFNWNWVIAGWDLSSFFYIPHITKITIMFFLILYIFIRGFFIPLKKQVKLFELIPFNWVIIIFISLLLDLTKILSFTCSRISKIFISK